MIKLGIIACSNGMGHISRSIKLASYLCKYYSVHIITNKKKFNKLNVNKKIKLIDSKKALNVNLKKKKYDQNWPEKIKRKIKKANIKILISDNLPEVVNLNLKCLIISNFFWHELWNIQNNEIQKTILKIKNNKVNIFRNVIFKNKKDKFIYFGFLGKPRKRVRHKKNLLISFGSEDKTNKDISEQIKEFIKSNRKKYNIYLDKNYFNKDYLKKNIYIANYTENMFKKIDIAIIKPGFGILQKCFEHDIYAITFFEGLNYEFKANSKNLKKSKLGLSFKKFQKCLDVVKDKKIFKINYKNKYFSGEIQILKYLKQISNNHLISN